MFIEILISIIIGISCGIVTGLIPGIHVNLISVVLLSLTPFLAQYFSLLSIGTIIISMAITHSFLDSICGTYLGMPDSDQVLGLLPAHRMLKKGEGHNAVVLTLIGSLLCVVSGILFFPVFLFGMKVLAPYVKSVVGYVLIIIVAYMVLKEKGMKKVYAFFVFLVSGFLGMVVLGTPNLDQPMLHMLSGLFGFSLLLLSLFQDSRIPDQKFDRPIKLGRRSLFKAISGATGIGFIAAFLPGFGSSQAAIIAQQIVGDIQEEGFLVLVGGINTANTLISIATAYSLGKARNGAILVINKILEGITFSSMMVFIVSALIVSSVAVILGLKISKVFCRFIMKIDYKKLIIGILCFIVLLSLYFDGYLGLFILFISTCVGLIASKFGVGKNHLMGCLMLPVILFFV